MNFRAILLGCGALLAAASGARAADLPIAEPADQYVRICDAFGAGFYYIPGTDTCLKISGYVRAESHYVDGDADVLIGGGTNTQFNNWTSRARANVMFDAQTSSDLALIRTYVEFQMVVGSDSYAVNYSPEFDLVAAFVEASNDHGVFTAGHTGSFFDFYGSDDYGTRLDIDDNTTEQTLFAYTLLGPSGLKGTLSVEDPASSGRRLNGAGIYGGQELPDLVGNIRLERDWGTAQVMGALRHIHDTAGGDGVGWAASAGFNVKLPIHNVSFATQFGYADGALGYLTNDPGGLGDFSTLGGDDTNQAWMARGGFLVPVTATVSTWLDGSFTRVKDDVDDDDYNFWAFVIGAAWAPNANVSMGPEVAYNNLDGDDPGEDGSLWGVMWRVESNF